MYTVKSGFSDGRGADYGGNSEKVIPKYFCFLANAETTVSFDIYIGTYKQSAFDEMQKKIEQQPVSIEEEFGQAKDYSSIHLDLAD